MFKAKKKSFDILILPVVAQYRNKKGFNFTSAKKGFKDGVVY